MTCVCKQAPHLATIVSAILGLRVGLRGMNAGLQQALYMSKSTLSLQDKRWDDHRLTVADQGDQACHPKKRLSSSPSSAAHFGGRLQFAVTL